MCGACKLILNQDVEGFMSGLSGKDRDVRLSEAIRGVVDMLDEDVQNALSKADYWLLQQGEPTKKARRIWRERVYTALEKQAGFKFADG